MDRRSFVTGLGSSSLLSPVLSGVVGPESNSADETSHSWDTLTTKEKTLRLAEYAVPGTDLEKVALTSADLPDGDQSYELYQDTSAGTPFVESVTGNTTSISPGDVAVRAYVLSHERRSKQECPHYIDSAVIALPSGATDEVAASAIDWEDEARSRTENHPDDVSLDIDFELAHDRGLSRVQTLSDPRAYRIQRLCVFGDRMLVTWTEGLRAEDESCRPLIETARVEARAVRRCVRTYLDQGNPIPDDPPNPGRSRWRQ